MKLPETLGVDPEGHFAQATAPAPSSPYPTVQILQAAMAHRDSIRRSFESQRATLAEAIAAQKRAVTQAVANTQQGGAVREDEAAAARRAMAIQRFLDALQALIAEEVARQQAANGNNGGPSDRATPESAASATISGVVEPNA